MRATPLCLALAVPPSLVATADLPGACAESPTPAAGPDELHPDRAAQKLRDFTARGHSFDLLGSAMVGDGLRFNNPYRLSHELGRSGESLSTTAPYLELAIGATTGGPGRVEHGARFGWSTALGGVPQFIITPAYQAVLRVRDSWVFYGWAGVPIVLNPDPNVGAEIAVGSAWLARAGLGLTAALVGDGFYGAGTRETRAALYPVLSAQVGVLFGYEVLP